MLTLIVGDVVGKPGRRAVQEIVPALRCEYGLDMVIANGENIAGGAGLTLATARELLDSGVDVITTGNHVWAQKDIIPHLDSNLPIVRPLNYPPGVSGRGYWNTGRAIVVNVMGRTFMASLDCPFRAMDSLLGQVDVRLPVFVDFHAEATSEKVAMGRYLDGRVSSVTGTHTHVGTIDTMVLPGGTAYVTDVGMVGPTESVIGNDIESVLHSFLTRMPHRMSVGTGPAIFSSVLVRVDDVTRKALSIERIQRSVE